MLNGDLKKQALDRLEKSESKYQTLSRKIVIVSTALFELREFCSEKLIREVEDYFQSIANKPIEFDKEFAEYKARFTTFENMVHELRDRASNVEVTAGSTAGAGIAGAVGVAMFAPTAAMAVATTFGVASTGTAISALSGAAATNAALAWLGGGALAAGGGGMAAGNAFLALSGPIGWAIGGATLVGSALFARHKNSQIAEEALRMAREIETYIAALNAADTELNQLISQTREHKQGIESILVKLSGFTQKDFKLMGQDQIDLIIALKNNVESLSKLIQKKVDA